MDWRHRRYFCIRLPSTTQYVYNKYMKLIKSVPTVKVHPVKYNMIQKFPTKLKSSFSDEIEPRGYHNITVSVYGIEETKWLLAGLEMMFVIDGLVLILTIKKYCQGVNNENN